MLESKEFDHLETIFKAAVNRVDPVRMIADHLRLNNNRLTVTTEQEERIFDLESVKRILVLGAGKASARMAVGLEKVLGNRIDTGLISVKYGHTKELKHIELIEAGHPVPDDKSLEASRRISDLARKADENTLVINLISGGGSALLAAPIGYEGTALSLQDKQETTKALLACGATINEINSIRKHLSAIKGGRLAQLIHPARCLNLILSDVVGDRLDTIASGLTSPDESTYRDALDILEKYDLQNKVPPQVLEVLKRGADKHLPDTPKPGVPLFDRCTNILLGTNYQSLLAAADKSRALGYNTTILTSHATGEAKELAKFLLGIGKDVKKHDLLVPKPACIIAGGETTVTLQGDGKGGRNQELALSFLAETQSDPKGCEGIYFLSASTDGNDGPTDAAGAFASVELLSAVEQKELNIGGALKKNDSYHFFDELGALLRTGPTNTNVCDLKILIVP